MVKFNPFLIWKEDLDIDNPWRVKWDGPPEYYTVGGNTEEEAKKNMKEYLLGRGYYFYGDDIYSFRKESVNNS